MSAQATTIGQLSQQAGQAQGPARTRACIGLPADRSGVYGLCQDWLQNHGLGVYEPQRRWGEGTLPGEWTGTGFNWRPQTVELLRQLDAPMLWHVGEYYYLSRPQILRNAMPALAAMREVLDDLTVKRPWFLIDEPPHFALDANGKQRFKWTQEIENDVTAFVQAAQGAGFEVAVAMAGPSQLYFWRQRLAPDWWIVHDKHSATLWEPALAGAACWLYNAETYEGLADRMRVLGTTKYLQWSGVRTTAKGPVPVLFDAAGVATEAAWELVRQLGQAQGPARTVEERLAELTTEVVTTRGEVAELKARVEALEGDGGSGDPGGGSGDPPQTGPAALFYSSDVGDWQRELARLTGYRRVVINAEMATATHNSRGEAYAPAVGGVATTPLRYLLSQGVDVWLYVSPWWIWTASELSGPGEWLRLAQRETAEVTGAWLLDWQGQWVRQYGSQMTVVDARNESYRRWLGLRLLQLDHDRFFLDQAWPHQQGYHGSMVSDAAWVEAASDLYRTLRAGGRRVMLNGGWEFDAAGSGDLAGTERTWPLREVCDGVAVECPGGFRREGAWWSVWEGERRDLSRVEGVANAWRGMGKEVMIIAAGSGDPAETERTYWREAAARMGVWWACQRNYVSVPEVV